MHRTHVRVVVQIADQKDTRRGKRCNHACSVQLDLLTRDQRPSRGDQDGARAIQRGVEGGEEAVIGHLVFKRPEACAADWRRQIPQRILRWQKAPIRRWKATMATSSRELLL